MVPSDWIAYHSEVRRGFPYPGQREVHEYEIGPERTWLAQRVKGARIWVVVGKKSGREEKTRYYLQAAYACDRSELRTGKSNKELWISGPELAYFDSALLLNEYPWWSDVSGGNFQGGLVPLSNEEAILSFEEHLRVARMDRPSIGLAEALVDPNTANIEIAELELIGSEEGRRRLVTHYSYERDRSLAKRKISLALRQHGRVQCECCDFDFMKMYGDFGKDFCEVHHTLPLSRYESAAKLKTELEDLAIVCSNCHRVLHWNEEISVQDLRTHVMGSRRGGRRLVKAT